MKLLICTQAIDSKHPVLGFFHRWVEEFAKHYEHVHVICLYEGAHHLPENVTIHSLGKEKGQSRLKYLFRFYKYIWQLRKEYDTVFVHMNQVYVIIGAPFWRAAGKRIGLWYMHKSTGFTLWLAEKLTHKIFTASKESFRITSKKLVITGHGIDTERFKLDGSITKDLDLIAIGRLSPAKNFEQAIETLEMVRQIIPLTLTIIGGASSTTERVYEEKLKQLVATKGLIDCVTFVGPINHDDLPSWLNRAQVFLHTATNGSLDKTLLESLAVGVPAVSSSPAAIALPLNAWHVETVTEMAQAVINIVENDHTQQSSALTSHVLEHHSLQSLIPKIVTELTHNAGQH